MKKITRIIENIGALAWGAILACAAIMCFYLSSVCAAELKELSPSDNKTDSSGKEYAYAMTGMSVYDTEDESTYDFGFKDTINEDGVEYKLSHIEYDTVNLYTKEYGDTEIPYDITRIETVSYNNKKSFQPENDELTENGHTYVFSRVEYEETDKENILMSSYIDSPVTEKEFSAADYPETIEYEYEDGNIYDLSYKEYSVFNEGWHNDYNLDGVIINYDAATYQIGDVVLEHNDETFAATKEQLQKIIEYWGYAGDIYEAVSAEYAGDAYENSDGVLCRNYVIYCNVYGRQYHVVYESEIEFPVYTATVTYSLSDIDREQIESLKASFEVTATAYYDIVEKGMTTTQKVVLTVGIIFGVLVLAALIIYLLRGGRRRTEYMSGREARKEYRDM